MLLLLLCCVWFIVIFVCVHMCGEGQQSLWVSSSVAPYLIIIIVIIVIIIMVMMMMKWDFSLNLELTSLARLTGQQRPGIPSWHSRRELPRPVPYHGCQGLVLSLDAHMVSALPT